MGKKQLHESVNDGGNGIVHTLANASRKKRESREQSLDVGIAPLFGEKPRRRWMDQGKLPSHLLQVGELALVIFIAHSNLVYLDPTLWGDLGANANQSTLLVVDQTGRNFEHEFERIVGRQHVNPHIA